MTRDEFIAEIMSLGEARYHSRHPFHIRMHEGKLSKDEMRTWILNRFYYQKCLPVKDALIVSKLKNSHDRRLWLKRITDHDGEKDGEGGIERWLDLGLAAGLTREEMLNDTNIAPAVRFSVDAYVNFCRLSSWWEAVASSLTELFAPRLVAYRIEVIEQRYGWIENRGLEYFRKRLSQAPGDSEHALSLVLRRAATRKEQEKALAAVRFKCEVLWSMLDAIEKECNRAGTPA